MAAFFGLSAFMYNFYTTEKERYLQDVNKRQYDSMRSLAKLFEMGLVPKDMRMHFQSFGFDEMDDIREVNKVFQYGTAKFRYANNTGQVTILELEGQYYLHVKNFTNEMMLRDTKANAFDAQKMGLGYGLIVVLLVGVYVMVINSIYPLKTLREQIRRFAHGEMDFPETKVRGRDEIAEVAREFYKAAGRIKELQESRELFLRSIMHELKTPITKGRLVTEMVDNEKSKKRLVGVFERLELLIEEFAKIEKLNSKNYEMSLNSYHASDLINHAIEMLCLDEETVEKVFDITTNDQCYFVDFELFSLMLKNLMDNAHKYSSNNKVGVVCEKEKITVSNAGEPLKNSLDHHHKPFSKEQGNVKGGLGLGIYIIKHIAENHNAELTYRHEEGINYFSIVFQTPL